jgi:hypothetical protein
LNEIITSVSRWPDLAREHGVPAAFAQFIADNLRLSL